MELHNCSMSFNKLNLEMIFLLRSFTMQSGSVITTFQKNKLPFLQNNASRVAGIHLKDCCLSQHKRICLLGTLKISNVFKLILFTTVCVHLYRCTHIVLFGTHTTQFYVKSVKLVLHCFITNFIKRNPWELIVHRLVNKFPAFYVTKFSLQFSQTSSAGPYPE